MNREVPLGSLTVFAYTFRGVRGIVLISNIYDNPVTLCN